MPHYRIYTIGRDNHFVSAVDVECADDKDAIQKAQQAVNGQDVELWEQGRFVARLMPGDIELRERGRFVTRLPSRPAPK